VIHDWVVVSLGTQSQNICNFVFSMDQHEFIEPKQPLCFVSAGRMEGKARGKKVAIGFIAWIAHHEH